MGNVTNDSNHKNHDNGHISDLLYVYKNSMSLTKNKSWFKQTPLAIVSHNKSHNKNDQRLDLIEQIKHLQSNKNNYRFNKLIPKTLNKTTGGGQRNIGLWNNDVWETCNAYAADSKKPIIQDLIDPFVNLRYHTQWIPSIFHVHNDGSIQITSDINGLPFNNVKNQILYKTIASIFKDILPLFECVIGYNIPNGYDLKVFVTMQDYIFYNNFYYVGSWHREGIKELNIIANAIYYFDITDQQHFIQNQLSLLTITNESGGCGPSAGLVDIPINENTVIVFSNVGTVHRAKILVNMDDNEHIQRTHSSDDFLHVNVEQESIDNNCDEFEQENNGSDCDEFEDDDNDFYKISRKILTFFLIDPNSYMKINDYPIANMDCKIELIVSFWMRNIDAVRVEVMIDLIRDYRFGNDAIRKKRQITQRYKTMQNVSNPNANGNPLRAYGSAN